jgi:cytochrome P450
LYDPSANHRHVLTKHIKNQVDKRLKEKQTYGDSWKRPDDLLQDLIEQKNFEINNINYAALVDKIRFYIFATVHTTSRACANAMMDLASRPEYMQELYEEQLEIHKQADENGILPFEALNELKKLDSFIRESLRLTGHIAVLQHILLKDHTFSNGLQVPKDHAIEIYSDDINRDESLQGPNPKSFEPFRHLGRNASASKVGRNFVVFGGGKHA